MRNYLLALIALLEECIPPEALTLSRSIYGLGNVIEPGLHGFTSRSIEPGHLPRDLHAPAGRIFLAYGSNIALFGGQVHNDLHYFEPDIYQLYSRVARQVLLRRSRLCFQVLLLR